MKIKSIEYACENHQGMGADDGKRFAQSVHGNLWQPGLCHNCRPSKVECFDKIETDNPPTDDVTPGPALMKERGLHYICLAHVHGQPAPCACCEQTSIVTVENIQRVLARWGIERRIWGPPTEETEPKG